MFYSTASGRRPRQHTSVLFNSVWAATTSAVRRLICGGPSGLRRVRRGRRRGSTRGVHTTAEEQREGQAEAYEAVDKKGGRNNLIRGKQRIDVFLTNRKHECDVQNE